MYTIKQALNYVYQKLGKHGSSRGVGANYGFLLASNQAVDYLCLKGGYRWSWLAYRDNYSYDSTKEFQYFKASYPIKKPENIKFWVARNRKIQSTSCDACENPCQDLPQEPCCKCMCTPVDELNMSMAGPHDVLRPGQYRIESGDNYGMGGVGGRVIVAKFPNGYDYTGKDIWISYYRYIPHAKDYDTQLEIPEQAIGAWSSMVAYFSFVNGFYAPLLPGSEKELKGYADELLEFLQLDDTVTPEAFDMPRDSILATGGGTAQGQATLYNNNIV